MNPKIIQNAQSIDVHRLSLMYQTTSLGARDVQTLGKAISKSSKVVVIEINDEYCGAGRLISDGIYSLIVDLAVLPSLKGKGLGQLILNELLKSEDKKFVYLNSTWEAEEFYKKQGFKKQKTGYAKYPFPSDYLE